MLRLLTRWLLPFLGLALAGHEILYKTELTPGVDLLPHELAIIQFDSRVPLMDYWDVAARWNRAYCERYGHQYMFLSMQGECSYGAHSLSMVWCKVKAMLDSNALLPRAKAILYLDSDAVLTVNYSMTDVLSYVRRDLKWDYTQKPVALNQDGPGWSCKQALGLGFEYCLNSGTVFWIKGPTSLAVLKTWWDLAAEPYDRGRFTSKWRQAWPWEQAQLYKVHDAFKSKITRLSFPNLPFLPWTSKKNPRSQYPTDFVEPWCFSHWPGANCFITHHCSSEAQKRKLRANYVLPLRSNISSNAEVEVHYIPPCLRSKK